MRFLHRITTTGPVITLLLTLLLSTLTTTTWAIDFGDFGDFGQNQNCKAFSCSKGYAPVPKKKKDFTSAGCNAMGGGGLSMFGAGGGDDEGNEKAYETCCHQFHACYQVCGSVKQACDANYDTCVKTKCAATADEAACTEQANLHTMVMKLAGCRNHEAEQNKHCTCVTKYGDKHLKGREAWLREFYSKYAPESVAKAKDLIQKAGETQPKFAKLMVKLIQKYPNAIEIVEDPQAKMYRKMFEKTGDFAGGDEGDKGGESDPDFDLDDEEEGEEDIEDFDVNEDLGGYGEDEAEAEEAEEDPEDLLKEAEEMRNKAEKLKAEREAKKPKKKRDPPPPRRRPKVEEPEEEEPVIDEFNQYEEL